MFHNINLRICEILLSLPSRERGLKCQFRTAPHCTLMVASFAGAWIEIQDGRTAEKWNLSLPSRERGSKYGFHRQSLPNPVLYLILKILPSRQRQQKNWKKYVQDNSFKGISQTTNILETRYIPTH